MNTLICAGGSGTRAMEAVLHVCAAGLGPASLRLLVIDPDHSNGNFSRTQRLVESYMDCREAFGGKSGRAPFFGTELDLMAEKGSRDLRVWSPVGKNQRFGDVVNKDNLNPEELDLVHLFFSDPELDMNMDQGFRGHPSIGSAALALLPLYRAEEPWGRLGSALRTEVSQQGSNVAIVGSVFGGTGAATIDPLTRFLRTLVDTNKDKLRIAAVAMVPYFQFAKEEGEGEPHGDISAQSDQFSLATETAAQYYQHLRDTKDFPFDAMYWVGDDTLVKVKYSEGGPGQRNPAHFADLLGALAAVEFLNSPETGGGCHYCGPGECTDDPRLKGQNVLGWDDLPLISLKRDLVQRQLLQFLLAGAAHTGFFAPLLADPRLYAKPKYVPWYWDLFASKGLDLRSKEAAERLDALSEFYREFHFPWWFQIHGEDANKAENVRLFRRAAFGGADGSANIDPYRWGSLQWSKGEDMRTMEPVDRFFSDSVVAASAAQGADPSALYVSMMAGAAERFIAREYNRHGNGKVQDGR